MAETPRNTTGLVAAAIVLIVLGILALMGMGLLWPMFVLVPGFILLGAAMSRPPATAGLAVPGMLITGTGALLFVQNLTGYWESWSYAWTLYGAFLGLGLIMTGRLGSDESLQNIGRGFLFFSLIAFAVVSFFMEILIGINGGMGMGLWPFLLIGVGGFLLLRSLAGKHVLAGKPNRRQGEALFTGPVVYGSRRSTRLTTPDSEAKSTESARQE